MSRALPALALVLVAASARAQPWVDRGPSLGLPAQLQGPSGLSLSAGITAADLDADGDLDLIATSPTQGLVVYLRGPTGFTVDEDLVPAMTTTGEVFGHTLFDADGDGDLDLFVARNDGDRLFLFDGARFVDRTDTHLPHLPGWSATATAADLDGDGDLDLLLARYIDRIDFPAHRCFSNRIFSNEGDGVFTDTTPPAMRATRGCTFSLVALDFDDDLDLDVLAANDFAQFTGQTELWQQAPSLDSTTPELTEVAAARGLVAPLYGMGAAFEDLDQDGQPELLLTSIGEPLLFSRAANHTFRRITGDKNLWWRFAHDRHLATWTTRFLDLDGDGHLDILAAGGALPAAPFIGTPPDMGSVILLGAPDGSLSPLPLARDLPRAGHSARDFELADLTGDGRDELVTMHVHGRISIFENLVLRAKPTRLLLRPSATGANAAGALVTLTCAGVTRTRRVTAGGDYGVHDRGQVDVHFPAPCRPSDEPVTGTIRWPSGFTQTVTATTGATTIAAEPDWLTVDDGRVVVDLGAHASAASDVQVAGTGVTLSATIPTATRTWEATYTPSATAGRLAITVDGQLWGARPRVRPTLPDVSFGPTPVVGRATSVRVRPTTPATQAQLTLGATTVALAPISPEHLGATIAMPLTAGPHTLFVRLDGATFEVPLTVAPELDLAESEVVVRELHVAAAERSTRRVRLRSRLLDANFDPAGIPLEALSVLIDGQPAEPDMRAVENGFLTLSVEHSRLADGSTVQLTVRGVPVFAAFRAAQYERVEDLGRLADATTSRCFFSEPQARADGSDRVTALLQFNDAAGVRLPEAGLAPTITTDGLTLAPAGLETGFGGWKVDLVTSARLGPASLSATLPGMTGEVRCQLELVAPPTLPAPVTTSLMTATSTNPTPGTPIIMRLWPHGVDGRSLGSGVPLTIATSDNAMATQPTYVGLGRYDFVVIPNSAGPVIVQARRLDGVIIAALTLGEAPPVEPGPEPDPEPDPEPGPEPEPWPEDLGEHPDESDSDDTGTLDTVPPDTTPDAGPEAADTAPDEVTSGDDRDAAEDTTEPARPETSEPSRPRPDDGCRGGPLGVLSWLGWLLFGASPRRPRRQPT